MPSPQFPGSESKIDEIGTYLALMYKRNPIRIYISVVPSLFPTQAIREFVSKKSYLPLSVTLLQWTQKVQARLS
jgi:hypothetical protein